LFRHDRLGKAEKTAQRDHCRIEQSTYQDIEMALLEHRDLTGAAIDLWLGKRGFGIVQKNWKWKESRTRRFGGKAVPVAMSRNDFDELVALAQKGNETAINSLHKLIASDRESFRRIGDLSDHVKNQFISLMTRGSVVARQSLIVRLDELANDLQSGKQSAVSRLVIDQIIICWLDVSYQQAMSAEPHAKKGDADFADRRLGKSQKRYMAALELLARVDRLLTEEEQSEK
jgi:hypothetical protein